MIAFAPARSRARRRRGLGFVDDYVAALEQEGAFGEDVSLSADDEIGDAAGALANAATGGGASTPSSPGGYVAPKPSPSPTPEAVDEPMGMGAKFAIGAGLGIATILVIGAVRKSRKARS